MAYGNYGDLTPARAGTIEGLEACIESRVAKAQVSFGAPLFYDAADEKGCYNPVQDKATVTLSADLVTSNVITSIVKLNGVALTTVASTFATDHATTMTAHIAAIHALTGVACVAGATNRAFIITGDTLGNVTVTTTVTLGGSQATATYAYASATLVFGGVSIVSHREFFDAATGVDVSGAYPIKDMVNSLNKGSVWVKVPSISNTANKPAYVILNTESADYGKFTTTATNNYDSGCWFKSNPLNGLAIVEVRGIK